MLQLCFILLQLILHCVTIHVRHKLPNTQNHTVVKDIRRGHKYLTLWKSNSCNSYIHCEYLCWKSQSVLHGVWLCHQLILIAQLTIRADGKLCAYKKIQPILIECWQGSTDRYCISSLSHLIRNPWPMNLIKAHSEPMCGWSTGGPEIS